MRRIVFTPCLFVTLGLTASLATAQPAPPSQVIGQRGGVATLILTTPGVSGFETAVRETIRGQLDRASRKYRVDEAGNLIVTIGQGAPHVLVCANMDEDGYFVSGITDDGYLRLQRVTTGVTNRLFEQMHYGQPIVIHTARLGRVDGVIATASTHLQRGRDQSGPPKGLDDLWVDVGAQNRSEVEGRGIRMLDPISLRARVQELNGARLAGVAAQARAIDYALFEFAARLDAKSLSGTLTIAWTVQGSFGERGMARLAQEVNPDRVIVLARTPMPREGNNAKGAVGQLGAGALVADNDAKSLEQARQQALTVQAVAGVLRAPNVWPAAKTQTFSLPVLYAQTPVETIDAKDLDSVEDLLAVTVGVKLSATHPIAPGIAGSALGTLHPITDILAPLIETTGVSGAETPVREAIVKQLPKWAKPQVDERGNLTVSFGQPASAAPADGGASAARELLFVAHMDEIGYEITDILQDGTASVVKRGGFFDYLWEAHPVFVQTPKGVVKAIVAPRPTYLTAQTATPRAEDIVLYFGTTSAAETQALGVTKGNTATIRKQLTQLAGSRRTARSMDDRCGVAALIAALKRIDPTKVPNRVTFAFVVGEETGLVGSGFLAQRTHPQYVFAIDTFVSSDSPVDPQRMALVPLGSGVVARAIDSSSITPPETVARVVAVGRNHDIPVTPSTTSGGNDGSQFSRYGSIVVPLSWPGRYSHSPVEVMDLRDLEQLVGLIVALTGEM